MKPFYRSNVLFFQTDRPFPLEKLDTGILSGESAAHVHHLSFHLLKRCLDILVSLLVIIAVLSWLIPLLVLLILLDSGRPVFFVQQRVGKDNRTFRCYKLKTLPAGDKTGTPGISKLGHFLRYYKLDETPQFFNVLRGDMSIVGPRPHMLTDHEAFHRAIGAAYLLRHQVRPGITGLAQISGYEGPVTSLEKLVGRIRLDLFYIKKWSLGFELRIIGLTIAYFLQLKRNQPFSWEPAAAEDRHLFVRNSPSLAEKPEELKKAIIKTLLYFEVFSFPLQLDELHQYCSRPARPETIAQALKELCQENYLTQSCCYFFKGKKTHFAVLRTEKYRYSLEKMKTARRCARIISHFPFVRGVAISGSLSKYAADEKADIDFFIITTARRLWICRSFLHLFKKLTYLVGQQHHFCMNYFLDLDELELKDQNIYTAVECVTILPVYGSQVFKKFHFDNRWIRQFFPNLSSLPASANLNDHHFPVKRIAEWAFFGRWGDWCNRALRTFTVYWWTRKFKKQGFPMQYFKNDLRATIGESKYHPNDYQRRILQKYQEKVEQFDRKHPVLQLQKLEN